MSNSRSKSSKAWLQEHFNDAYVKQAQQKGYRSRAVYKLLEIQQKDQILKPGMAVVDLGAAPGGWCQVAKDLLKGGGEIVALDILPMESLADVHFIQGDFTEDAVLDKLLNHLQQKSIDLVMSDMAPNMSGIKDVDQAKSIYLVELSLDFCHQVLKPKGTFLSKIFQGEGFDEFVRQCRKCFDKVVIRKPKASRARSTEVYLLGKGYRGMVD